MKRAGIIIAVIMMCTIVRAQRITPDQYISTYKDIAIAEMKRSGIPASVTLAQGLLETESGNSDLVQRSNNHFGIKCKSTWKGESVTHTDDAPNECFRKYPKAEDSYRDHTDYLKTSARYASLFELAPSDYKGWAYGLKRAGYATNPKYPQILINNIEKYNLQQYDNAEPVVKPVPDDVVQTNEPEKIKPVVVAPVIAEPAAEKVNEKSNGLKAVFANKGTSLLAIATKADIPLTKLLEYNDLGKDGLLKSDCWIYLEKKSKEGNRDIYISQQDETLYDVSQTNGIQLKSLAAMNSLSENAIVKKGMKIKLRSAQSGSMSKSK